MNEAKYIVGIDLGTTHCVLAYTRADAVEDQEPEINLLAIPQVVEAGEVKPQPLLPSFMFLPGPHDVPPGALALPWNVEIDYAVGEFARGRGAELPARLVSSAKSWLCHSGVDRAQPILPWDAPKDVERISPLAATTRYLEHIRNAWNHQMAVDDPAARLESQAVYLTVPASFDAVARELTIQAARQAGLVNPTLLEEPQAAFYAWLEAQKQDWRDLIQVGESILVCDVGGGTTDFSLIQVTQRDGVLDLQRVAVGDHILLGGDNMDLTLAYAVRAKLAQQGTQLDNWQFRGLWFSCRQAKEQLLGSDAVESVPVVILGRGSSLIGGTIRTELTRQEIETILVQGFFPTSQPTDYPQDKPQIGVREMGLPYESDPAITRHMARFLGSQISDETGDMAIAFPSAVLFNGGVMKAPALRTQIAQTLQRWSGHENFRELQAVDLDQAVAMGAAYYGLARRGRGIRIRAGTALTYYIGIESAMPAVPGVPTPVQALCVVPFGMEEGGDAEIIEKEFGLVVGRPAVFPFLASSTRKGDTMGQLVEDWSGQIHEVTTLEAMLPATGTEAGGTVIPVWIQTRIQPRSDDVRSGADGVSEGRLGGVSLGEGVLEIWCIERDGDREWKLEFDVSYNPT